MAIFMIIALLCGASTLNAQTEPRPNPEPPSIFEIPPASQPETQPEAPRPPPPPIEFSPIIRVVERGTGPITMMLIPGVACDWTVFESFMERNKSRYTMYAVNLPGFGSSDPPPPLTDEQFGMWLDNASKAIWAIIREKQLPQVVVVGHAMGGHLALRVGCEHINRIRAIISIDGGPASPAIGPNVSAVNRIQAAQRMRFDLKSMDEKQWADHQRQAAARMVTDPKRAQEIADMCLLVPAATTIQYTVEFMAADIRTQLPKLTFPTLMMATAASADPAMNQTVRRIWTGLIKDIPDGKLAFFENTRSFIMDDRAAELDAAIDDFLAGREVKGYTMPPQAPVTTPAAKTTP